MSHIIVILTLLSFAVGLSVIIHGLHGLFDKLRSKPKRKTKNDDYIITADGSRLEIVDEKDESYYQDYLRDDFYGIVDSMASEKKRYDERLAVPNKRAYDLASRFVESVVKNQKDMMSIISEFDSIVWMYDEALDVSSFTDIYTLYVSHYGIDEPGTWYIYRSVMVRFCDINKISRRQLHHRWSRYTDDRDNIADDTRLHNFPLHPIYRNDDIVNSWVTNSDMRGALSYPTMLYGFDVAYMDNPFEIKGLALLIPSSGLYTTGFMLTKDGKCKEVTNVTDILVDSDSDGNPTHEGSHYLSPAYRDFLDKGKDA